MAAAPEEDEGYRGDNREAAEQGGGGGVGGAEADHVRLGEKRISFNFKEVDDSLNGGDGEKPTTQAKDVAKQEDSNSREEKDAMPPNPTSGSRSTNRLLNSFRKSRRQLRKLKDFYSPSRGHDDDSSGFCDILSLAIHGQMFHIAFLILSNLNASDLSTCERVCTTWRDHLESEKIWRKTVNKKALTMPNLAKNNGWAGHISSMGTTGATKPYSKKEMKSVRSNAAGVVVGIETAGIVESIPIRTT